MSAEIIDGKASAARLVAEVERETAELISAGRVRPCLAAVLVGEDPASEVYVRRKIEQTERIGMRSLGFKLPSHASEEELLAVVARLNADPEVHGILVQLPLPAHIDRSKVLNAVDPDKDVDGFHPVNVGRLLLAQPGLAPCTPTGCLMLLEEHLGSLEGRDAVVIGCSNIVGRPVAEMLLQARCTVSIAHIHTVGLSDLVGRADILVAAAGSPGLVRGSWLKRGSTVIDVGINRIVDEATGRSRLVGDVCFEEALERAGAITPVPGGVGPMTIACLLRNTMLAARRACSARIEGVLVPA